MPQCGSNTQVALTGPQTSEIQTLGALSTMAVPQLVFESCQLDAITLSWRASEGVGYRLEFREILVPDWAECRSEKIAPGSSTTVTVTDLNPSSSYIFRLYTVAKDGREVGPGPEVAFDTEVVSCAPSRRSCCIIS